MNIKGRLIEKFDTQQVSDSFKKREFVVEYAENPQYPELLKFELIQSNCEQLDQLELNSDISVTFNLKGRKWTDRQGKVVYFNSLQAWRVEAAAGAASPSEGTPPPPEEPNWMSENSASDDEDLPF
ncbi:MAG: DUF3127 domain-containing protein [Cytophagales bacterium]|nr:DUF3127 domain-containing protein [Cytophagales bacterium]